MVCHSHSAAFSSKIATRAMSRSELSTPTTHQSAVDSAVRRHWHPAASLQGVMPAGWWPWLSSSDSLTQRLDHAMRMLDGQGLRVRLLLQDTGPARRDEARMLGIAPRRHVWRREVALCHGDQPWVIARSLAALDLAHGHRLSTLGEGSLGHWLFRQPDLTRSTIDVSRAPLWLASPQPLARTASLWMRRSMFSHGRFRVLVQEGFTPRFQHALEL